MTQQIISAGTRFRITREGFGLSQQEVADACGISRNTVSNFENNEDIKLSSLIELSVALNAPSHIWLVPDAEWFAWHCEQYGNKTPRGWVTLEDLPPGFVFVTQDGILAVKSEYHYSNGDQWRCVLLASGEYAHFEDGNNTLVSAIEVTP